MLFLYSGVDVKYQDLWQLIHAVLYPLVQPGGLVQEPADFVKSHHLTFDPGVHLAFWWKAPGSLVGHPQPCS